MSGESSGSALAGALSGSAAFNDILALGVSDSDAKSSITSGQPVPSAVLSDVSAAISTAASLIASASAHESTFVPQAVNLALSTSAADGSSASAGASANVNASIAPSASGSATGSAAASASGAAPSLGPGWHFSNEVLWNGTGPDMTDVQQGESTNLLKVDLPLMARTGKIANCWEPASAIAIVNLFPEWIANLITYPDGTKMAGQSNPASSDVLVTLWNPNNGWIYTFGGINIYNESTTDDFPGQQWWHSALSQGYQRMAEMTPIFGMNSDGTWTQENGSPAYPMAMMTGRSITYQTIADYDSLDDFFTDLTKGSKTPIALSSAFTVNATTPAITANHDYAVLGTSTDGGGQRWVKLRNPWGTTETFKVEDLKANFYYLYMFDDQSPLVWS